MLDGPQVTLLFRMAGLRRRPQRRPAVVPTRRAGERYLQVVAHEDFGKGGRQAVKIAFQSYLFIYQNDASAFSHCMFPSVNIALK
jgi:hypothetical protein